MKALIAAAIFLGLALLICGVRAVLNHLELRRLKRNGYRKLVFRRMSERGSVDADFLRGIAEGCLIILLLVALFGWLGFH